ncbi:MAG: phosphoribosylanthranilate isomerase [bacterium]|nr:phosphoribosylanthranilate isomerase [Candidatus Sumerlaeota bacterium]
MVKIKICGMTNAEDALACARADADYLGYVFSPGSKRFVQPDAAAALVARVRSEFPQIFHVGVFVDQDISHVLDAAEQARLDVVQLHGSESPEYCARIMAAGFLLINAFRFGAGAPTADWAVYSKTDFLLCDTYDPSQAGGTGHAFDRCLMPPDFPLERAFVAGGLNPDSVGNVIKLFRPYGVDVSSGVEIAPGRKSRELVARFIHEAKAADSLPLNGDSAGW